MNASINPVTNNEAWNAIQAVLDVCDDGIVVLSENGMIIGWNQRARNMFGYTYAETAGAPAAILMAEKKSAETNATAVELLATCGEWRCKDGRFIKVSVRTFTFDSGTVKGSYLIAKPHSDSQSAEERILQLTRQLEALSYSVSHDLRAPVRSILNYSQILEEEYLDKLGEDGKKVLSIISRNSEKLMQLIEDLLALARVWKHGLSIGRIDMNAIVKPMLQQYAPFTPGKLNIKLHDLHHGSGDKNLLPQVWHNLISNAIKYSAKKETAAIEIGSSSDGHGVTYFVKDNGAGFDMQYANKLFTPFQRLHSQNEFEGNGIGLAIVQQIVSRHLGRVWAEATVNEGATFFFWLPSV